MRRLLFSPFNTFSSGLPKFDYSPPPYKGESYEKIMDDRKNYMPTFNTHYYKEPLLITEGKMQYLFDHKGNRYQDWIGGISTLSVGHSHPKLIKAIQDQNQKIGHISQTMLGEVQAQFAKRLCQELGPEFDAVYFCNSGGQANDFAIQLTKLFTKSFEFLSLRGGYHGLVGAAANSTSIPNWISPISRVFGHQKLAWPNAYRTNHDSIQSLKRDAQELIKTSTTGRLSGMILQPIQGVGGVGMHIDGYHKMITELVRSHGGLIISDQVQTGFGRVGTKYWGFKHFGFKPDIITMAKGIGNGIPIGAVVTRREIAQALNFNWLSTTGGGNVQCRGGIEIMNIIKEENLPDNVQKVGSYILKQLARIKESSPILGDVRGAGFMIGMQFVKDKKSKQPQIPKMNEIFEKLKDRHILAGKGGAYTNVIRLQPPMCMTMEDAQYFVNNFEEILKQYK